ncbi:hypothetical protein [Bradyrhizobium liaoningense]|uniref:hypothetical protein n=1 Tax=Bradyrhizobium liaoningense TaxID=43992 RepID=UPI001BA7A726|nr:hypothetical protein [Bradyrhizobium liaoningense]MBR0905163.1 hypothetical protein [Bradyrhizobium liaoningense]
MGRRYEASAAAPWLDVAPPDVAPLPAPDGLRAAARPRAGQVATAAQRNVGPDAVAVRRCAAPVVAPSPAAAAWLAARPDEPWPVVPPDEPSPVVRPDGPSPAVLPDGPWPVVLRAALPALRLVLVVHPVRVQGVPGPTCSSPASRHQPEQPSGKRHAEA